MTEAGFKSVFDEVEKKLKLKYAGCETHREPKDSNEQLGDYLMMRLPFDDEGHRVMMEMGVFKFLDSVPVLRFDSTIFIRLSDVGIEALEETVPVVNDICIYGHFSVMDDELYHRYSLIVPEDIPLSQDVLSASVLSVIDMIRKVLSINYDVLEEAVENDDQYMQLEKGI